MNPDKKIVFARSGVNLDYTNSLAHLAPIKECSGYVDTIAASQEINALAILYAMLCQKPIVIKRIPNFKISPTLRSIIDSRINKFILADLALFSNADLRDAINNLVTDKSVNYVLTKKEQIIIKAALRQYFRDRIAA